MNKIEILEKVVLDLRSEGFKASLREDYSGRGMFGASCVGIVTDEPMEAIVRAASFGLKDKPTTDDMGKQTIVYYKSIRK